MYKILWHTDWDGAEIDDQDFGTPEKALAYAKEKKYSDYFKVIQILYSEKD